jgi:hypothetical protein
MLRIFIVLKNPLPCPGFEPATFGFSGQHTNHYTTKPTYLNFPGKYIDVLNTMIIAIHSIWPQLPVSSSYHNHYTIIITTNTLINTMPL